MTAFDWAGGNNVARVRIKKKEFEGGTCCEGALF